MKYSVKFDPDLWPAEITFPLPWEFLRSFVFVKMTPRYIFCINVTLQLYHLKKFNNWVKSQGFECRPIFRSYSCTRVKNRSSRQPRWSGISTSFRQATGMSSLLRFRASQGSLKSRPKFIMPSNGWSIRMIFWINAYRKFAAGIRSCGATPSSVTWWQAIQWPFCISLSTGISAQQISSVASANGQRLAKRQPGGGSMGLGGSPFKWILFLLLPSSRSMDGTAERRAQV